jgi:Holliday junction resolvase RusA-like endonuclease
MLLNNKANFQETLKQMIINEEKAKDIELKNKMAKITEQMFKTATSETTQETNKVEYIKITKEELDQLKTELAETKIELEETKKELEETKAKLEEQHIIVNDIIENNEQEKEKTTALLIERDFEIDKLNNELKEYRPRSDFIELPIYGLSVNDMYSYCDPEKNTYENGQPKSRSKSDAYKKWIASFKKELNKIGINNLKKKLNLDSINFNKPLQLNVSYGILSQGDLDNMQKAFQDCLFRYLNEHGYKSDDCMIHKLILDKTPLGFREYDEDKGFIRFSLFNK